MNDYTISWDGKLLGCQMLQDCWTYPFIDSFENAWLDYPSKVKLSRLNASIEAYKCDDCENSDLCSTCVATRMAETGESFGCPKYICDNHINKVFLYIIFIIDSLIFHQLKIELLL